MILITGASQGIGFECARTLLSRTGATVMITARSQAGLERAQAAVPARDRDRLLTRICDQDDRAGVESLVRAVMDAPSLDGAILNVGVNPAWTQGHRRIHTLDAGTIEAAIRTNCTHTLLLTAAVLDRLRVQRSGVLIWIGSQSSRGGLPGAALYCATKSFLSGLARAAHHEYAGRNVRVHLLHPGVVRTPRTAAVADRFAQTHQLCVHEPEDVAGRIVTRFLRSEASCVEVDI